MNHIMTAEETDRYVFEFGAAALGDRKPDLSWASPEAVFVRENFQSSVEKFRRMLYDRFSKIPERVTDDPKVQELIQSQIDELIIVSFGNLMKVLGIGRL